MRLAYRPFADPRLAPLHFIKVGSIPNVCRHLPHFTEISCFRLIDGFFLIALLAMCNS